MHWIENDSRGLQCLNCTNACSPIMKPNAITMAWVNRLSKDSFATSVVVIVWRLESTCFWTPRLPLLPITSVYLCHHHLRCGHHTHYLAIQQHLSKDAKMDQQSMSVSRSKDSSNRSILFSSKSLPQPISQQISLQARAGWNWIMRSSLLIEFIKSQHGSQLHKGIVRRKMHLKWLFNLMYVRLQSKVCWG